MLVSIIAIRRIIHLVQSLENISVQFSHSVMSDSLRTHELQHTRPPCPSPTPGVHPNPCPLSQWSHRTISSSIVPFSSCPQSFKSNRVFSNESALCIRWPKYRSFSVNISPSNEHPGLISLEWTGWTSLQSKGLSTVFSNTLGLTILSFSIFRNLWNGHNNTSKD